MRAGREIGWAALAGMGLTVAGWAVSPAPAAALSCPSWAPVCMIGRAATDVATTGAGSLATDLAGGVADVVLDSVAAGFLEAYLLMFRWATTWWLSFTMTPHALVGSIDSSFGATIAYVAAFVMVIAVLSSAITTIWRRDGAVVADTAAGVFKAILVIGGAWAALGVAWRLADQLTSALAPSAANISVDPILNAGTVLAGPGLAVLVICLSAVGFVLSLGAALMMLFRLAAVVVLALLLPIAAAGSPGTITRGWLPKVIGWLLALIFLRPMVAAVYRIGFEFMAGGNDGDPRAVADLGDAGSGIAELPASAADGLLTMVIGMMTLLVAMLALPVLLRLFTWMFGGGPGGGGAGLAAASLAANGAIMARGLRSSGASQHAQSLAADLGPTAPSGGPIGPVTGLPGAGPSSGAGAAAAGAPAASAPGAAGGAAAAGAGGAGAAAGPAGLAVAAGVMAVGAAAQQAANAAANASIASAHEGLGEGSS
jgi:hypothetical protein